MQSNKGMRKKMISEQRKKKQKEGFTWTPKRSSPIFLEPLRLPLSPAASSGSCIRHIPAASFLADTEAWGGASFFRPTSSSGSPPTLLSLTPSWIFHLNKGVSGLLRFPVCPPARLRRVDGVRGWRRVALRSGWRSESGEGAAMAGGNGRRGRVESPEIFIGSGEYWPFEEYPAR